MPESKKDKTRKEKVNNYKTNRKKMNEQAKVQVEMGQNQANQLPPVREIPTWGSKDQLDLNGLEFEYAYNAVAQLAEHVNTVFGALQSVMQNNLSNGKIKLHFEKLENGEYVKMTPEEEAPHQANFQTMVEKYKATLSKIDSEKENPASNDGTVPAESLIEVVQNGIVDAAGQPISSN